MLLSRRRPAPEVDLMSMSIDPVPGDAHAAVDLSAVLLPTLLQELKRRGFDAIPTGVWENTVGELEARIAKFEAVLVAEAERQRGLVDGTELVRELAHLAGTELPKAVGVALELMGENAELQSRADRAETDATRLAHALIGGEVAELETNPDND